MINFRFHLVSLVAVFLALGLGILVGSTVVDQKIVDRLDSEINSVRKENSERKAANKQLAEGERAAPAVHRRGRAVRRRRPARRACRSRWSPSAASTAAW